jgi:DNA-binding NarL/FixJ family response regulator
LRKAMAVLVADEDPRVRRSVVEFLRDDGMNVVGEAADCTQAVELSNRLDPSIIVIDLCMWIARGAAALPAPGVRVLVMTMHLETPYVYAALAAGVSGYVIKTRLATCLKPALRAVANGEVFLCRDVMGVAVRGWLSHPRTSAATLDATERSAMELIGEGHSDQEIALRMGTGTEAAADYRAKAMRNLCEFAQGWPHTV